MGVDVVADVNGLMIPGNVDKDGVLNLPYGNETSTIRIRVVKFCTGIGLDLGCGGEKIVPSAIGIDVRPGAANLPPMDFSDLRIFSSNVFNYVYSSHALEDVYYKETVLREWWRVLKPNGHLVLVWPDWEAYARDETHRNTEHQKPFEPKDIKRILARGFHGEIVMEDKAERSTIMVIRKLSSSKRGELVKKKSVNPEKSALVVRYGAFGDAVMITPVFRALKDEGYHVTVNCSEYCAPVLENNPNIDEVIVHGRDSIKNDGKELPQYWKYLESGVDRFINLSGSIEGSMLLREGDHPMGCDQHPDVFNAECDPCRKLKSIRHGNLGSANYYDRTMQLSGLDPDGSNGELFFTHGEIFRARDLVRKWRRRKWFVVIWSMSGSSFHKAYPYWETAAINFLRLHPDAVVYTVGDNGTALMEIKDHPRIFPRSGKWTIRESMCMTQYADLVIGGETGILHAAACYDTPKVVLLSHSSEANLCRTWKNYTALEPSAETTPCYPCHQLHYTKESCPLTGFPSYLHNDYDSPPIFIPPPEDESQKWPLCMTKGIPIQSVVDAMEKWYAHSRS